MKNSLILLLISVLLSSCATVKFYEDSNLETESGIEFYSAKPYLLVEKNPAKDVSLKSTVIYLPDISKPKYAKIKSGLGSSDLKLSLSNGIITSYGVVTDSKIPETITALTGVLSATGTTYKAIAEGKDILKGDKEETVEQAGDVASMQKAQLITKSVIKDLDAAKTSDLLTLIQQKEIETIVTKLKVQDTELGKLSLKSIPSIAFELDKIIALLTKVTLESDSDSAKDFKGKMTKNKKDLVKARNLILPSKASPKSTFELYEIKITNAKTELIRVELPDEF